MSRRIAVDLLLACLLLWVLPECTAERWEGQYAGECSDDADNDADSLYDCNDPDCAGAPACQGDDDDVADDDSADDDSADDDDSGGPAVGDDDDSALGPCRPVDHLWDPATEPLRLLADLATLKQQTRRPGRLSRPQVRHRVLQRLH